MNTPFSKLKGKTLKSIDGAKQYNDEIIFTTEDNQVFRQYHSQDCCESVSVEEIHGNIKDLLGSPILLAEEVSNNIHPIGFSQKKRTDDSYTYTFYKLSTIKGSITIRWYGCSNGYYSERVDFEEQTKNETD